MGNNRYPGTAYSGGKPSLTNWVSACLHGNGVTNLHHHSFCLFFKPTLPIPLSMLFFLTRHACCFWGVMEVHKQWATACKAVGASIFAWTSCKIMAVKNNICLTFKVRELYVNWNYCGGNSVALNAIWDTFVSFTVNDKVIFMLGVLKNKPIKCQFLLFP